MDSAHGGTLPYASQGEMLDNAGIDGATISLMSLAYRKELHRTVLDCLTARDYAWLPIHP
jgi:hypothetical protein